MASSIVQTAKRPDELVIIRRLRSRAHIDVALLQEGIAHILLLHAGIAAVRSERAGELQGMANAPSRLGFSVAIDGSGGSHLAVLVRDSAREVKVE